MTVTKHPDLDGLKRRLEIQAETLAHQLSETKKQLESVSTTLELLRQDEAAGSTFMQIMNTISVGDLRGLTQLQALVKIAKSNGNRLKLTTAKELLLRSGVTKSRKNANNIIFNVIKRSGQFRRVALGEYELIESKFGSTTPTTSELEAVAHAALKTV